MYQKSTFALGGQCSRDSIALHFRRLVIGINKEALLMQVIENYLERQISYTNCILIVRIISSYIDHAPISHCTAQPGLQELIAVSHDAQSKCI